MKKFSAVAALFFFGALHSFAAGLMLGDTASFSVPDAATHSSEIGIVIAERPVDEAQQLLADVETYSGGSYVLLQASHDATAASSYEKIYAGDALVGECVFSVDSTGSPTMKYEIAIVTGGVVFDVSFEYPAFDKATQKSYPNLFEKNADGTLSFATGHEDELYKLLAAKTKKLGKTALLLQDAKAQFVSTLRILN